MTAEAWIALASITVVLGIWIIGIWNKTRTEINKAKSEIDVVKNQVKTLKEESTVQEVQYSDLRNQQVELESKILEKLIELTKTVYRVEGKLDSKADKK